MKTINLSDLTIVELVNYAKACEIIIDKYVKGSDYYRGVPENMMSDEDLKNFYAVSDSYKKYRDIEESILKEIEERLEQL